MKTFGMMSVAIFGGAMAALLGSQSFLFPMAGAVIGELWGSKKGGRPQ